MASDRHLHSPVLKSISRFNRPSPTFCNHKTMAITLKTISAALKLVDSKKDNLKKAYDDLHAYSHLLSSSPLSWSEIDSHFTSIQNSLTQRFRLLESQASQPSSSTPPVPAPAQNPNDLTQIPKDPSPSPSRPSSQNKKLPAYPSSSSNPSDQNGANVVPENFVVSSSVMPRFELSTLCEKMDGKGLRQYVNLHSKEKTAIQAELPGALRCAPDPAKMVLDSLDGFYGATDPRDMEQRKLRRACIVLLEQLRILSPNIGFTVRDRAKMMAAEWKASLRTDGAKTLEALGFLHFVVAYGLLSEVSLDELVDFTAMAANNDEVPQLCRIIGLTEKIPNLVQRLVDEGKHVLAVKYVFEFSLADKIPPISIVKACVDEADKLAKRLLQEGKSMNEALAREIHALRSVIKVIENYKLESQYPPAILEKQIVQLNKLKSERKRAVQPLKLHPQSRPQQQPHQQKNKKQKQKQQIGNKHPHPQTSAQVGPTTAQKIVNVANSALRQYQQPLAHQPTEETTKNAVDIHDYECRSTTADNSGCQRESDDSGNAHLAVDDDARQSPDTPKTAVWSEETTKNAVDILDYECRITAADTSCQRETEDSGNTHLAVDDDARQSSDAPNTVVLPEATTKNAVDTDDHERANTAADNSPSQRKTDDCGNTHLAVDDDSRQSPGTPNMAVPNASAIKDSDDEDVCISSGALNGREATGEIAAAVGDVERSSFSGFIRSLKRKWFPEVGNSFDGLNKNLADGSDTDDDSSSSSSSFGSVISKVQLPPNFLRNTCDKRRKT